MIKKTNGVYHVEGSHKKFSDRKEALSELYRIKDKNCNGSFKERIRIELDVKEEEERLIKKYGK